MNQIIITMDQQTVDALAANGYKLDGLKAVGASGSGGQPTLWFQTARYSLTTVVQWEPHYDAYVSRDVIIPDGHIAASASYAMTPGQTLDVTSPAGTGTADPSLGVPGVISIRNSTSTEMTCGIEQQEDDGPFVPLCALPLPPLSTVEIAPVEKVFLMFSITQVSTGTTVRQSYGPGILIDVAGASARTVSFDINEGWTWGGYPWASAYPANTVLAPLLIEPLGNSAT